MIKSKPFKLHPPQGVVFDMDGTLTRPQTQMFTDMRRALNIEHVKIDVLDHLATLSDDDKQLAEEKLAQIEESYMLKTEPTVGVVELFQFLSRKNIKYTVCTRNLMKPVLHLLETHLKGVEFCEPVVTRSFRPTKPAADPLLHIAAAWGFEPKDMVMVGDSRDDMLAGLAAGFTTVLLRHEDNAKVVDDFPQIDYVIRDFHELIELLDN
ncbi:uncharacterized protein OGAPODRAFT_91653 [Ogataea polymorpha]|uniref:Uncharacterized protein n=1 Tax=Ogataea polymorpha TaxID=460523 RepID=A0A1B7SNU0_9ASCO|nr:uncharacterized protein OGAPODRAFT_91653 [Ogataea polymorpha]KAG7917865.1 hypothetical protein KL927_002608 [Ogataea polymorpha]KAG7930296.1 hypothetical protein KL934_004990 [Ogataea polymorpha]KAH3661100.1 hypothetical protein OGATHE_005433 [Ogataea polymorpha]OBA18130.1 hypothetical protein OGAPODRAFT_91653 [Ogataea polymorpha]